MELVTSTLSGGQILDQVPEIANLFASWARDTLVVEYGWGSGGDADCLWKESVVPTHELVDFVLRSVSLKVFKPGVSDLLIADLRQTIRIKLCHEGDIHLFTDDRAFVDLIEKSWAAQEIPFSAVAARGPSSGTS